MITRRVDAVRRFTARTGDTRIVEEDYGAPLRKPVRHERIPVVKAAAEVLKEDERRSAFRAEAPVCVANSVCLDEADWSRDVGVFRHIYFHGYSSRSRDCVGALRLTPAKGEILAGSFVERDHQVVRRYAGRRGDTGVDVFQQCKPRLF